MPAPPSDDPPPPADNLGLLKLVFALLLFVAYGPQLAGGDRSFDPLFRVFGKLTVDDVATDGLVMIAGYHAMRAFMMCGTVRFLALWTARLLPGFGLAFWLSALVVAPLGGGQSIPWLADGLNFIRLLPPATGDALRSLPWADLDHPLWAVGFLVRVLVVFTLAGWLGAFRAARRPWVLAITALLVVLNTVDILDGLRIPASTIIGYPPDLLRFASIFMTGVTVALYRDTLPLAHGGAVLAAVVLVPLLAVGQLAFAEGALTLCGGYLLFWAAFRLPSGRFGRWARHTDLSYGLYLWVWPILSLALYFNPGGGPALACLIALPPTVLIALAHWLVVEKPLLALSRD